MNETRQLNRKYFLLMQRASLTENNLTCVTANSVMEMTTATLFTNLIFSTDDVGESPVKKSKAIHYPDSATSKLAIWLALSSPMTIFNQSEWFIFANLKFVYDIGS